MLELILSFILGVLVVLLHNKNQRVQKIQTEKKQQEQQKEKERQALGEESFSEKLQDTQGPVDDREMVIKFLNEGN